MAEGASERGGRTRQEGISCNSCISSSIFLRTSEITLNAALPLSSHVPFLMVLSRQQPFASRSTTLGKIYAVHEDCLRVELFRLPFTRTKRLIL